MNKVLQSMKIAFRALRVNKLRSALTMLGVIIGVGAVIAMVAVGSGATKRIQEQIASIGSNVIIIQAGSVNTGGVRLGFGNAQTLTEDDARAVGAQCPSVALAAPIARGAAQIVYGNNNWATQVIGTTPDYLMIRDAGLDSGQPFTQSGRGRLRQGRSAGQDGSQQSVQRRRSHRPDHSHQESPLHRGGRALAQGPVAFRSGSGRYHHSSRSPRQRKK